MKINFIHPDIEKFIVDLDDNTQADTLRIIDLLGEKWLRQI